MMVVGRRGFLTSVLASLVVAPSIVRAETIMPIRAWALPSWHTDNCSRIIVRGLDMYGNHIAESFLVDGESEFVRTVLPGAGIQFREISTVVASDFWGGNRATLRGAFGVIEPAPLKFRRAVAVAAKRAHEGGEIMPFSPLAYHGRARWPHAADIGESLGAVTDYQDEESPHGKRLYVKCTDGMYR